MDVYKYLASLKIDYEKMEYKPVATAKGIIY